MKIRSTTLLLLCLALFDGVLWFFIFADRAAESATELYFFDVGQGDSELIILPRGKNGRSVKILVDGGPPNGKLLGNLSSILPLDDRYIDLVVMTHPQLDHFGGFIELIRRYEVGRFIGTGRKGEIASYRDLEKELQANSVGYVTLKEGDTIKYRDASLYFVSPSQAVLASGELNDTGLVFLFEQNGFRALYTGDADENIEAEIRKKYDLAAQVLKVGHHGSKFSSSAPFLAAVKPFAAVIEVGKNTYGHPHPAALSRLAITGARLWRTDRDGTIKISLKKDAFEIFQSKEAAPD